jgi:O-antigen/teichoic acid export membrane protein
MAAVAAGGTVAQALWSQAVVDGAAVLTALGVWRARRPTSSGRGALAASRLLVSRGLPFAGVSLVLVVQADAERLILGLVGHAQELALYAVPYGLLSRLTVVAGAVATALLPRLVSAEAADDARGSLELVRRSTRVLVALLAVPVIVAIAVLPEFLEAWIGSQFRVHATRPARIAAVAVMVSASIYPLDAALRASKRPSALLWIYIPQLFLLAGVYWAITRYGVVGAAGALLVRCVADGGLHEIMGTRVLGRASGAWREAIGVIAVVAGFAALCEVAGGAFPVWLRGLVAMGICGIVVWWRLQAADWQALRLATARAEQGDA